MLKCTTVNDAKDARGNTALHFAAGMGLAEICKDLVEVFGADVSIKNAAGLRAVDLALNMQEQYLLDQNPSADYDEVVRYLDGCSSDGNYHYFFRDNYVLFVNGEDNNMNGEDNNMDGEDNNMNC